MVEQVSTGHKNPGPNKRREMSRAAISWGGMSVIRAFAWVCAMSMSLPALARETGPVTNLPLPRYVSLKASEGNVRRGPSLTHRIDWVFKRRDMPLRITAEHGHWRRVEDRDGMGGWVHYSLLSGTRTVIVQQDLLTVRARPATDAPVTAAFEAGVIARLGKCDAEWCRVSAGGHRGWAPTARLWGVRMDEVRN